MLWLFFMWFPKIIVSECKEFGIALRGYTLGIQSVYNLKTRKDINNLELRGQF